MAKGKNKAASTRLSGKDQMRFRGLQSTQPASHRAYAVNSEGQILSSHFPAPKVLALVLSKKGSWCYAPGFRLQRTNWERSGISGGILRIGTFSKLSQRVLASRNLHPSLPPPTISPQSKHPSGPMISTPRSRAVLHDSKPEC